MPNWVFNEVDIHAPLDEVQAFFAPDFEMDEPSKAVTRFNLHKLYPDRFSADDLCGFNGWDYDWMVENTGSKWNPNLEGITEENGVTFLGFDSAWSPMNELLARLHILTGWTIHNEYEEEQPEYEGSFHCEG
ncbi:hypothetical protein K3757_18645 (plasmid) [Sulfitobacter sp. S223]|uniref:hypothetical protein n=1 Tax=Sulfitobacter sp. S223 TaxID=2867023 RepID=UPI0021A85688|nr:hypothetical protein [Sulfitobacter sp. S223]UWR28315.1 hypothetical protein K3757_18645 [Sulfitobacter sp. S223]